MTKEKKRAGYLVFIYNGNGNYSKSGACVDLEDAIEYAVKNSYGLEFFITKLVNWKVVEQPTQGSKEAK